MLLNGRARLTKIGKTSTSPDILFYPTSAVAVIRLLLLDGAFKEVW